MFGHLQSAAQSLGCTAGESGVIYRPVGSDRDVPIGTVVSVNGGRHGHWEANRADGGFKSLHRSPELAVLALLTTYYTPARGQ